MSGYTAAELIALPSALGVIILISVIMFFVFRRASMRARRIVLMVIPAVLIIMEIVKQSLAAAQGYWDLWYIPVHFCSMFMVWFAIAEFSPEGRFRRLGQSLSFVTCLLFIILFYIAPQTVIGTSSNNPFLDFPTFHKFFFHQLVLLQFGLMLVSRTYRPHFRDILPALTAITVYFFAALAVSNLLDVNYFNMLYTQIPFVESIRQNLGQVIYLQLYYLTVMTAAVLIFVTASLIVRKPKSAKLTRLK